MNTDATSASKLRPYGAIELQLLLSMFNKNK